MGKSKHIAVFDIGKTNKKVLLFDENLKEVYTEEEKFETTVDDDGFECDDIEKIETWIKSSLTSLLNNSEYNIEGVNFCTYGATLVFLDKEGKRLTPVYNYLKEIPADIQKNLFSKYGGEAEFCRKTASPALGLLLNSGIQILWLKKYHPEVFSKVDSILHFPQYLSGLLTGEHVSEPTSIGCHTFMWDFDKNAYHTWLKDEGIVLPEPQQNTNTIKVEFAGKPLLVGIGIHDSSSSLIPYVRGSKNKFILVSTGTWSIHMNPFNHQPLTPEELKQDCLAFMGANLQPVKSSRLFGGHIHDVNVERLNSWFKVSKNAYKTVAVNEDLLKKWLNDGPSHVFFSQGVPDEYVDTSVDLSQFSDFDEAYNRLMLDLTMLNVDAIRLISIPDDGVKSLYVSGGFARNPIFMHLLASFFPDMEVFTTEIDNATALGAALVIRDSIIPDQPPEIELNIQKWEPMRL